MPNSRYILVPWQGAAQRIALARPLPEVIQMPIGDGGTGMVELFRLTLTLTGRSM